MERIDDLQYKGLKLIQDDELFCFGCDAVELANFVKGSNADACDLGCGNGIIATLIAAKRGMRVTGVEIQPESASLAERNARLNSLADRIEIVCAVRSDFMRVAPAFKRRQILYGGAEPTPRRNIEFVYARQTHPESVTDSPSVRRQAAASVSAGM